MRYPIQVTFHNLAASGAVESAIRRRAEKLSTYFDRIISCRVVVEVPHWRHHQGNVFAVRIDIAVPGDHLSISREPARGAAHEDVYVAIRDAFDTARRQLQDHARKLRDAESAPASVA